LEDGGTVLCTYFLPIAAIRYRTEAHILNADTDTDTEDTTTDDIAVDTSATRTSD